MSTLTMVAIIISTPHVTHGKVVAIDPSAKQITIESNVDNVGETIIIRKHRMTFAVNQDSDMTDEKGKTILAAIDARVRRGETLIGRITTEADSNNIVMAEFEAWIPVMMGTVLGVDVTQKQIFIRISEKEPLVKLNVSEKTAIIAEKEGRKVLMPLEQFAKMVHDSKEVIEAVATLTSDEQTVTRIIIPVHAHE